MSHFYVPSRNIKGRLFFFDPSESRHLLRVLRKKPGDKIRIFDGEGRVFPAQISDASNPERVTGEILAEEDFNNRYAAQSGPRAEIYPALIKGPRFEWLIEKATELGVSAIHPIFTERTLIRIKDAASKVSRWEKIALSAAKQCGRTELPRVLAPVDLSQALSSLRLEDLNLILWESEEKTALKDVLQRNSKPLIRLFVGPEGGFGIEEARAAFEKGALPVRLGDNILRAETASIAALSMILC